MREPHNKARGEVLLDVDGAPRKLCVTLGALAELEAAFDVASFAELGERLATLTPSDLLIVLAALIGGGGEPATVPALAAARIEPRDAAAAVAQAFHAAFEEG